MTLPPYNQNVFWKEYEIDTPTFDLTPIEKPDMSPLLFHMTGPQAIRAILHGEGAQEEVPAGCGFIRGQIPESSGDNYHAEVVCFTESPVFALDFFRYRSFRRWQNDVLYGVAFSKTALVQSGVFPCTYASESLKNRIVNLYNFLHDENAQNQVPESTRQLVEELYPLTTPLLELSPNQGFMWEREWRYPESPGFVFEYSSVEVVCCPADEVAELRGILGEQAARITFVETWNEYNEVTQFLRNRARSDEGGLATPEMQRAALQHHHRLAHSLEMYKSLAERLGGLIPDLEAELQQQQEAIAKLEQRLADEDE